VNHLPDDAPRDPFADSRGVLETPNNTQIEWMRRHVQSIGGVLLPGVCRPKGIAYPPPGGTERALMVNTTGCGNETMVKIPEPAGLGATKVCLVCDGAIEWPRLYGDEGDPDPDPPQGPPPGPYWS